MRSWSSFSWAAASSDILSCSALWALCLASAASYLDWALASDWFWVHRCVWALSTAFCPSFVARATSALALSTLASAATLSDCICEIAAGAPPDACSFLSSSWTRRCLACELSKLRLADMKEESRRSFASLSCVSATFTARLASASMRWASSSSSLEVSTRRL